MGQGSCKPTVKVDQAHSRDEDMLDLKLKRDVLVRQRNKLQANLAELLNKILEISKVSNQALALRLLRQRKLHQSLLDQSEDALDQIESLITTLEAAYVHADVIRALSTSNEALKRIQSEFSIHAVEEIMLEAEELRDTQRDISSAVRMTELSSEDASLLLELDSLLRSQDVTKILTNLPPVPTTAVTPEPVVPRLALHAS